MRVAIVITSLYESGPQLASLATWADDTERLAERLGEPDAGYEIEIVSAERGLADELERVLARCSPDAELLVYFGGYAVLAAQRGAALLLDAARPGALSIPKLRAALTAHAGSVLVLIDALAYLDPGKSWAEFAARVGAELSGESVSVVVAARAPDSAPSEALVSRALLAALDGLGRTSTTQVSAQDLCSVLEGDLALRPQLGCLSYYAGSTSPVIMQPVRARRASGPALALPSFPSSSPELGTSRELPRPVPLPPLEPRPTRSESGASQAVPVNGHSPVTSSFMDRLSRAAEPLPEPEPPAPLLADAHVRFEADDNEVTRVDHELSARLGSENGQSAPALSEPAEQWSEPTPTHSDVFTRPSGLGDDFEDATVPKLQVDDLVQAARSEPEPPAQEFEPQPEAAVADDESSTAADEEVPTPRPASSLPAADQEVPTPRPERLPALVDVDASGAMTAGDELMQRGEYQAAIDEYKRALVVLGGERSLLRSELYVRLGDAARALDKSAVALNNYDKALGIDPTNATALASAAELLLARRDFERLSDFYRRRFEALDDAVQKRELLERTATLWLDQAGDLERGVEALQHWLEHEPDQIEAWQRLVQAEESLGRKREALESRLRLVDLHPNDPERQAELLTEAARAAYESLEDGPQAVALAERAINLDHESQEALSIAAVLLEHSGELGRLSELYESVLSRSADGPGALELCLKLGRLAQGGLGDLEAAAGAYERAVRIDGRDPSLRLLLADLYVELGALEHAAAQCQAAALALPREADVFRRARAVFERAGDRDRAWNAACVIDFLGDADVNESLAAAEHRPEGLIAAQETLRADDWTSGLLFPELDTRLLVLLASLAEPVLELEQPRLAKKRGLPAPEPEQRHDLEKSTITLGKSLIWTARLIGVPTPELYIVPELEPDLVLLPGREPRCVASKALASGLSLAELAFVWGRQLSLFRPELGLLLAFPAPEQAAELFEAAFSAAGLSGKQRLGANAKRLAAALGKRFDEQKLRSLLEPLADRDALTLAAEWLSSAELACARVGLLACGDLTTALGVLPRFPTEGRLPQEQQVERLLAYAISSEYAELRRRLGVAVE